MDFIDLEGVSGAYRFRALTGADQPSAVAGNYVIVRGDGASRTILVVGVTNNLSRLATKTRELGPGEAAFVRLGVARSEREAVHVDLAAAFPHAVVESDAF